MNTSDLPKLRLQWSSNQQGTRGPTTLKAPSRVKIQNTIQYNCASCSAPYSITEDDLAFYAKVSPTYGGKQYMIPPPTLCAECRVQRRMAWRNDRTFYKRKCDLTGEDFVSMFPPDTVFPVYKQDVWHGDKWDALAFGRDVDFSRPFYEQWADLRDQVPHWGVAIANCENSDYCNYCTDEKNCYLDIAAESNENCYYDHFVKYSKDCTDCTFVYNSTLCYECIQCYESYSCRNSMYLDNCSDCVFCFDLKGCKNCLLSTNLRNKEYYILNEPHSKEEYEKKLRELNLGSFSALQNVLNLWNTMRIEKGVYRDMHTINCENCTGNNIKGSKNCSSCFNATNCEDCRYLFDVMDAKDCRDMNYSPYAPEASYEVISTVGLKFSAFYMAGPYNVSCFCSHMLQSCRDCFGCMGLKQKQYCILNKQYTKEEYEALVPKIIEHMIQTKEWGEFFPVHLSPHGYNETVAHEYMPLTKEEVMKRGWKWRDETVEMPHVTKVIRADQLPDNIENIPDDILNWAVTCEATGKPFKIVKQELDFYRQQGIPVPHYCPRKRHDDRNALRNPRKLWQRTCSKCSKEITTSYAPERPENVYCESCYMELVH